VLLASFGLSAEGTTVAAGVFLGVKLESKKEPPDPSISVGVVASLSPQEAALLAGRLQAEGIRAMTAPSQDAPGVWAGLVVGGFGLAPNFLMRGTTAVLVEEGDLQEARRIAQEFLEPLPSGDE
jgi:hypothetical protein